MKINLDVPDYDGNTIDVIWEQKAIYKIEIKKQDVIISANKQGLISIAKQMLYFAYNDLPFGSHIHYDSFFTKNDSNDFELIIEKLIK